LTELDGFGFLDGCLEIPGNTLLTLCRGYTAERFMDCPLFGRNKAKTLGLTQTNILHKYDKTLRITILAELIEPPFWMHRIAQAG
jgi:hypothetical protein